MKPLYRDLQALEAIPLKLIIISLVLAVSLPLIFAGLSSYDLSQTESSLRSEISFVILAAKQYYNAGGGAEDVEVNFQSGFFTKIEYVMFGDALQSRYESSVRYKLTGMREKTIVVDNPNVPLTSSSNEPFTLGAGYHIIHLEFVEEDYDGDGFLDSFIRLRKVS